MADALKVLSRVKGAFLNYLGIVGERWSVSLDTAQRLDEVETSFLCKNGEKEARLHVRYEPQGYDVVVFARVGTVKTSHRFRGLNIDQLAQPTVLLDWIWDEIAAPA